jgi:anti-anti-sigma regulatory factor
MRLTSKNIGTWGIFEVDGTVDSVHTRVFVEALSAYVNGGRKNVIIDLGKAPFLSIGAIRYINQLSQYLEGTSGRLALMGANDRIRRHIDIFISWKKLKEINSIWEVIPLQMTAKFNETESTVLVEPILLPSEMPDQS